MLYKIGPESVQNKSVGKKICQKLIFFYFINLQLLRDGMGNCFAQTSFCQ